MCIGFIEFQQGKKSLVLPNLVLENSETFQEFAQKS